MTGELPRPASARVDPAFWSGRRVLLTGHTGFKGAWLTLWLHALGADATGFALDPPGGSSLFALARAGELLADLRGDVRDPAAVAGAFARSQPEIVIHMAAQPLVRRSLLEPRETYETNVLGTVNVLDAARAAPSVRAIVNVTSDKCYAGPPPEHGFREHDPLGGDDPYSSSKAASELVTAAYRSSYFASPDGARLASARAGNVIGGGDRGEDRLVPDVIAAAEAGEAVRIRNPAAVRPWQHVLNALSGYLVLAQSLYQAPEHAAAWNFGPPASDARPVEWIVERLASLWPDGVRWTRDPAGHPPESARLLLDSSRARRLLGWSPPVELDAALESIVDWHREVSTGADARELTLAQIASLPEAAGERGGALSGID